MILEFMMKITIATDKRPYLKIFEAATDGLILSDLETHLIVEANPTACNMHGYSHDEFIGLNITAFIHPDNWLAFREYMCSFRSGKTFNTRVLHLRRDGSIFQAEWSGTGFDYQGRTCLLGVVQDVTRSLQAEQNLHQRVFTGEPADH